MGGGRDWTNPFAYERGDKLAFCHNALTSCSLSILLLRHVSARWQHCVDNGFSDELGDYSVVCQIILCNRAMLVQDLPPLSVLFSHLIHIWFLYRYLFAFFPNIYTL